MTSNDSPVASIFSTVVFVEQGKSGSWRAYLYNERTPNNPRYCSYDREVVRDDYGYIITESTRETLVERLLKSYPNWKWSLT